MDAKRLAKIERYVRSRYPRTAAHTPNGLSDTEIIAELLAEVQRLRRMPVPGRVWRGSEGSIKVETFQQAASWFKGEPFVTGILTASGVMLPFRWKLSDWLAWAKNAEVVDGST